MNRADTYTARVLAYLVEVDDVRTADQIAAETSVERPRVSAALHHLFKYYAVDAIADGVEVWWFATPGEDRRTYVCTCREEERPRSTRRTGSHRRRRTGELPRRT